MNLSMEEMHLFTLKMNANIMSLLVFNKGQWVITKMTVGMYSDLSDWIDRVDNQDKLDIRGKKGIYIISGIKSVRLFYYIGSTENWDKRWKSHKANKKWAIRSTVFIYGLSTNNKDNREFIESKLISFFKKKGKVLDFELDNSNSGHQKKDHDQAFSLGEDIEKIIIKGLKIINVLKIITILKKKIRIIIKVLG